MAQDASALTPYLIVLAAVLGLIMGSFLNCLAWRLTHGESVMRGRSHCTSCGHVLGPADLIPVVSWVASRGRCRYCGERVSVRYPITELVCCALFVSVALVYGPTLECLELIGFSSVLLVLSLTDLDDYVIPNPTIVVAIAIRVAYLVATSVMAGTSVLAALGESLLGGVLVAVPVLVLSLVMDVVLGRESLGGGDVKLLFVAGMYFGWQRCLFLVLLSCVLGIVFAALGDRGHKEKEDDGTITGGHLIPFGPAIAVACWVTMLVGTPVLTWYLGMFGL